MTKLSLLREAFYNVLSKNRSSFFMRQYIILSRFFICLCLYLLSACSGNDLNVFSSNADIWGNSQTTQPQKTHQTQPEIPISNQPFNKNKIYKVALLLPIKSGFVHIKQASLSLLNAAKLAHQELKEPRISLVVYPTDGTANTDKPVAQRIVDDKIDLIIGPLLAPSVVTTRHYSEPAGIPMLALSNDQTAVNGGFSYLLSYLPEQNIANIVNYAVSKGHKNFALMSSNNPYGKRVGDTFTQEVAIRNKRITNSVYFTENSSDFYTKARELAETDIRPSPQTPTSWSSVLFTDKASVMMRILPLLARYNVDFKKSLILGTGIWDDPRILEIEELQGAVFTAPNQRTLKLFEVRYQNMFQSKPITIASLAYDAVALAVGLVRKYPDNPFDVSHITNPNGFSGVGGIFRFRNDGLSERGLSVVRINGKKFDVVIPAPDTFSGS